MPASTWSHEASIARAQGPELAVSTWLHTMHNPEKAHQEHQQSLQLSKAPVAGTAGQQGKESRSQRPWQPPCHTAPPELPSSKLQLLPACCHEAEAGGGAGGSSCTSSPLPCRRSSACTSACSCRSSWCSRGSSGIVLEGNFQVSASSAARKHSQVEDIMPGGACAG